MKLREYLRSNDNDSIVSLINGLIDRGIDPSVIIGDPKGLYDEEQVLAIIASELSDKVELSIGALSLISYTKVLSILGLSEDNVVKCIEEELNVDTDLAYKNDHDYILEKYGVDIDKITTQSMISLMSSKGFEWQPVLGLPESNDRGIKGLCDSIPIHIVMLSNITCTPDKVIARYIKDSNFDRNKYEDNILSSKASITVRYLEALGIHICDTSTYIEECGDDNE